MIEKEVKRRREIDEMVFAAHQMPTDLKKRERMLEKLKSEVWDGYFAVSDILLVEGRKEE